MGLIIPPHKNPVVRGASKLFVDTLDILQQPSPGFFDLLRGNIPKRIDVNLGRSVDLPRGDFLLIPPSDIDQESLNLILWSHGDRETYKLVPEMRKYGLPSPSLTNPYSIKNHRIFSSHAPKQSAVGDIFEVEVPHHDLVMYDHPQFLINPPDQELPPGEYQGIMGLVMPDGVTREFGGKPIFNDPPAVFEKRALERNPFNPRTVPEEKLPMDAKWFVSRIMLRP